MQLFQNISIRRKQMLVIMLTSSAVLLLACAAFMAYDTVTFRQELSGQVTILADAVGNNCAAAIDFEDPKAAGDTLAALRANANIVSACVYSRDGQVIAFYQRDGASKFVPPAVRPASQQFTRDELHLFRVIKQGGVMTGTIFVASDLRSLSSRLMNYVRIVGMVFLTSLLAALLLSSRLQRLVSNPILHLSQVARTVAQDRNYSLRAAKQSDDEIGQLVDGFNEMLAQIQRRDAALQFEHDNLERRVEGRTAELAESLSVLNATLGSTADGILVVNREGKRIFQNQRTVDLWKIPPDIAEGNDDAAQVRHVMEVTVEPERLQEEVRYFYAHPDERGQDEVEFKDGTILDRITAPVLGKDGKNYGRIWTFRDVTKSRKDEAALRESQALYHSLVDQMPAAVFRKNAEGRYVFINTSFCQLIGMPAEQILGKTAPELLACMKDTQSTKRLVSDKLGTQGMGHHESIMRTGRQIAVEDEYLGSDGRRSYYHTVKSPVFDADGKIAGSQGILFNITDRKLAEEALQESQALYLSLVDQMPAGIFRRDKEGRFVFVNAWFCRIKGMKPDQVLGRTALEIAATERQNPTPKWLPEFAAQGEAHHELVLRTGQTIEVEEQYSEANGKTQHLHLVKSPVFDSDGRIVGTQGMLFDISAGKEAEAALSYERDLLRTLLDNSPDQIYFKDAQSRFIKISKALAVKFGVASSNETVGKSDFDFFTEEHARPAFEDEQEIIRTGRSLIGKVEKEVLKDGRVSWALTNKVPLRNKDGQIIGTFGISKNITDLKQAQEAAAYERDLLRTLLDHSPDSIFFKDLQSRLVNVSRSEAANLFRIALSRHHAAHPGESADQLPAHLASVERFHEYVIGKTDADTYGAEHAGAFNQDEREIIRTGRPMIGKIEETVFPDGSSIWHMTTKVPWRNKDGEIIGTFGTSRDISDLKNAEAKIEEAHKQLLETSRLAGMAEIATNVLHNVGNVLNSVNVSASLVVDNVRKSKVASLAKVAAMMQEHERDLGTFITSDAKGRQLPAYLGQLVEQLLADQKAAIIELELLVKNIEHINEVVAMQQSYAWVSGVKEIINVRDLVEDGLRMNAGALARHRVEVVREYEDVPPINVDKHRVLQILVNLIRNAKYACDESGREDRQMTVRVANGEGRIKISVVDNGIGIPPENLARVFNHGFTTRKDGHGFGLHSGALAAKEMGGSLTAQSDGIGCGAAFTLELPVQPKTAPPGV
jgi:PAS domain S-box-containing protein